MVTKLRSSFSGMRRLKASLQVSYDGQDLHRGQIQIVHQHAVLAYILGEISATSSRMARIWAMISALSI